MQVFSFFLFTIHNPWFILHLNSAKWPNHNPANQPAWEYIDRCVVLLFFFLGIVRCSTLWGPAFFLVGKISQSTYRKYRFIYCSSNSLRPLSTDNLWYHVCCCRNLQQANRTFANESIQVSPIARCLPRRWPPTPSSPASPRRPPPHPSAGLFREKWERGGGERLMYGPTWVLWLSGHVGQNQSQNRLEIYRDSILFVERWNIHGFAVGDVF